MDRTAERLERVFARISAIAGPEAVADEGAIPLLLPSVLELTAVQRGEVLDDCIASCETLRHAYGLLGIAAETRAVDLYVKNRSTGRAVLYGDPEPEWTGLRHNGHCVLWLPEVRMFIDPTVEQFPPLAGLGQGPIFGRSLALVGNLAALPDAETSGGLPARTELTLYRGDHLLMYNVAEHEATAVLLNHPQVVARRGDLRVTGANLAGLSLETLRVLGSWERAGTEVPYPKVRDYVRAMGDSPCLKDGPDVRFLVKGMGGVERRLRLDEIPL